MYGSNSATLERGVLVRSPVSAISPSLSSQPRPHDFSILQFFFAETSVLSGIVGATRYIFLELPQRQLHLMVFLLFLQDPYSPLPRQTTLIILAFSPCLIWIVNLELRSPSLQRQLLSPIRLFLSTNKKPVSSVPLSLGIFLINCCKEYYSQYSVLYSP